MDIRSGSGRDFSLSLRMDGQTPFSVVRKHVHLAAESTWDSINPQVSNLANAARDKTNPCRNMKHTGPGNF